MAQQAGRDCACFPQPWVLREGEGKLPLGDVGRRLQDSDGACRMRTDVVAPAWKVLQPTSGDGGSFLWSLLELAKVGLALLKQPGNSGMFSDWNSGKRILVSCQVYVLWGRCFEAVISLCMPTLLVFSFFNYALPPLTELLVFQEMLTFEVGNLVCLFWIRAWERLELTLHFLCDVIQGKTSC